MSRTALLALLLLVVAPVTPATVVNAQQADSLERQPSMETFARAHLAIAALRDRFHAEFAEPKNKKDERQVELREKLQSQVRQALKEHGLTEAEFARLTRLVSIDDASRKVFEAAMAKLAEKK